LRKQKKRKDSIYRFSDSYEFKFVEYEYKFEDYEFMFLVDYKDSLDLEPYTFNLYCSPYAKLGLGWIYEECNAS